MFFNEAAKDEIARLISPKFEFLPSGHCLTWYYNMNGNE
jgi:hypothetical protein